MKILVVSDLHLDWVTHGVPRFEELRRALLVEVVGKAVDEEIDAFLFLGDLCDPDSGPVVFRAMATSITLAKKLEAYGIEQVWIPGNHDVIEDGSGTTTLTPLAAIANDVVHVHERPGKVVLKESVTVITLPFVASSEAYDPESWVEGAMKGVVGPVVVAGHMTNIPGVTPGEEATEMPRGREVRFPIEKCGRADVLLNGHFHRQQKTESGIWIPGSLARLTFGESDHQPGFLIVEV